jgi:hypothetical protein
MITDTEGQAYYVSATSLYNNNLVNWKGWKCSAGVSSIYINAKLDIFGAKCCNDRLGSLEEGISLLSEYTTCNQTQCRPCGSGLQANKYDPKKIDKS